MGRLQIHRHSGTCSFCVYFRHPYPKEPDVNNRHLHKQEHKQGLLRRWIEEDNKGLEIMWISWWMKHGMAKVASSLVIYVTSVEENRGVEDG